MLAGCPVCNHAVFREFLKSKDHFLTQQEFIVVMCENCGFRFTNPRPSSSEISKYYESSNYISHNTQKKNLLTFLYRGVRTYSIRQKFLLIKKYSVGKSLLDIGCGTGEFLAYCSAKGFISTGIEPNETARNFAIQTLHQNVQPESFLEKTGNVNYDIITLWHVLEHLHDLNHRMERISNLLKPTGTLIIAVPNCDSWDAIHYQEFWAAYDLPRHLYHFTPDTLRRLTDKHGFKIQKILPLNFDAYYVSLLSEKYKYGHNNYFRSILNGLGQTLMQGVPIQITPA